MPHRLVQTLRWFGPADAVTLAHVRQAGAGGVVTALHHLPPGAAWAVDEIMRRKAEVEAAGLRWAVVESVPVHEDIKQARGDCKTYLDHYCQSLRNLGACGVRTVCYNFMAVTDWTRTDLAMPMPGGAEALRFDRVDAAAFDLFILRRKGSESDYTDHVRAAAERKFAAMSASERDALSRTILLGLPGTVDNLSVAEFALRLRAYDDIDAEALRANHTAFLRRVIPVAEEAGVVLAIHPDDPPFAMFGLPRIAGDEAGLTRIVSSVDSPANGVTFCTGSLGASAANDDLPGMLRRLGERVHFLHLRNVRREPDGSFYESDHLAGSVDMAAVMREAIALCHRRGVALPMRPDHGHRMLSDLQNDHFYPGYSAIGRLRGLAELRGLEMGLRHAGSMPAAADTR
jgi:mannonate dehydratase